MTLEKFMKILAKNNVQFSVVNPTDIYIDGSCVLCGNTAFIDPVKCISIFDTDGNRAKDIKDVKEADLKPMIAHYQKLHKYDPVAIVSRILLCGTELEYVALDGKTYSTTVEVLKVLKKDMKKAIEKLNGTNIRKWPR